jgi:phage regulator Rha-like protein
MKDKLYTVRGQRVIIDRDLAAIYGVSTKALNQAVKRNADRFPDDFAFQLTPQEAADLLRSQAVISNKKTMRSQNVTASKRNVRFCPYAFTEHGTMMAANVLRSARAVQMSVFVVRAFVKMRELLADVPAPEQKLAELEKKLTERLNVHEKAIVHVLGEIRKLMAPSEPSPNPPKRKIGFEVKEKRAVYKVKR